MRWDGREWEVRRSTDVPGWRTCLISDAFPEFEQTSTTANLIKDLIQALDRGDASTRGGVRCAYARQCSVTCPCGIAAPWAPSQAITP